MPMRRRVVTHMRQFSLPLLMLFAFALLMRAFMPSGWMPVASEGGLRIMVCSGDGPVEIRQPIAKAHNGHEGQDSHGGDVQHDPCPYGLALAKALDLKPDIVIVMPWAVVAQLPGLTFDNVWLVEKRSLRPPARGPPVLT